MDWRDRTIFPFYRQKRTLPEVTRLRLFKEIDALNRAGKYIRIPAWRDSSAASVRKTETIPAADKMAATANKSCKWFAAGFTRGKKIIADTVSYNAPQVTRVSNKRSIALGGKRIPFVGCLDPLDLSITFDPTFSKSNVVNVVLVTRERKIRPRKWRRWRTFRYRWRKGRKNEAGLPRSLWIPARVNRIRLNSCPLFGSQAKWKFSLAPSSRVPKRDEILEY